MSSEYPVRIAFAHALDLVRAAARARPLPAERVPLARARGRILAGDVVAPLDLPGFDNAAMDGFALRAADAADPAGLRLVGERFAGRTADLAVGPGECVRITTGAVLPPGADSVLMKEQARLDGDRLHPGAVVRAGQHVRRQGEDVAAGDTVLRAGEALNPARLALAAALGLPELDVAARPTVAVFTTGDELRRPGEPLRRGEIYDSNRVLLMALLTEAGLEPMALPALPDEPGRMRSALADAASAFDLVLTCGGVSAGEKDHLPALLREQGRIHFWKVRMKPGMPVLFGEWDRAFVLALPGNPVSVLATFLTLGRALVLGLQGAAPAAPVQARLAAAWSKRNERLEFLRGRLETDADGVLRVRPNPADGSHRMRAAADSDALIVLDEGARDYAEGTPVEVLRY
ncbi:gephyrin-like molybdotransferase Glp [Coralloluteibacterium thermophilus]|uniref:Molybdopterin molybdenumtransferase n=1 Tax=Coralloluteibacterium thermophilum TaxID=2707049 RepID=A0ABV9NGV8_9GAMM